MEAEPTKPVTPGVFLTAAYGLLDTQERKLVIGSAGHPPLLCLRADGAVEQIEHTGPALGLEPEAEFGEVELTMAEGDRLLLYTDGVVEATRATVGTADAEDAEMYGEPRLERLLVEHAGASSQEIVDRVFQAVKEFTGQASQDDDITVLALKFNPPGR